MNIGITRTEYIGFSALFVLIILTIICIAFVYKKTKKW